MSPGKTWASSGPKHPPGAQRGRRGRAPAVFLTQAGARPALFALSQPGLCVPDPRAPRRAGSAAGGGWVGAGRGRGAGAGGAGGPRQPKVARQLRGARCSRERGQRWEAGAADGAPGCGPGDPTRAPGPATPHLPESRVSAAPAPAPAQLSGRQVDGEAGPGRTCVLVVSWITAFRKFSLESADPISLEPAPARPPLRLWPRLQLRGPRRSRPAPPRTPPAARLRPALARPRPRETPPPAPAARAAGRARSLRGDPAPARASAPSLWAPACSPLCLPSRPAPGPGASRRLALHPASQPALSTRVSSFPVSTPCFFLSICSAGSPFPHPSNPRVQTAPQSSRPRAPGSVLGSVERRH